MAFSRTQWVTVSADEAQRHPLYGFGGWSWLLLLKCLGECVSVSLLLRGSQSLEVEAWAFIAYFLALSATLVLNIRWFRPLFFVYAGIVVVFALATRLPALAQLTSLPVGSGMPPYLFVMAALVLYVKESRRMNVTMCRRVAADDPFLSECRPS